MGYGLVWMDIQVDTHTHTHTHTHPHTFAGALKAMAVSSRDQLRQLGVAQVKEKNTNARIHARTHARIHARTHALALTPSWTLTHAYTHTHTQVRQERESHNLNALYLEYEALVDKCQAVLQARAKLGTASGCGGAGPSP